MEYETCDTMIWNTQFVYIEKDRITWLIQLHNTQKIDMIGD